MTNTPSAKRLADQLLLQDESLNSPQYEEHRMQLELELERAESRERWAHRIGIASMVLAAVLLPLGGSGLLGSFDPWDADANFLSVLLGIVYVVAASACALAIAAYYSRFRPRTRRLREQQLQQAVIDLQRELMLLRRELNELRPADRPGAEG